MIKIEKLKTILVLLSLLIINPSIFAEPDGHGRGRGHNDHRHHHNGHHNGHESDQKEDETGTLFSKRTREAIASKSWIIVPTSAAAGVVAALLTLTQASQIAIGTFAGSILIDQCSPKPNLSVTSVTSGLSMAAAAAITLWAKSQLSS